MAKTIGSFDRSEWIRVKALRGASPYKLTFVEKGCQNENGRFDPSKKISIELKTGLLTKSVDFPCAGPRSAIGRTPDS